MATQRADYGDNDGEDARRQMTRKHVVVINGAPEFLGLMRELLQDEQFNVTTTNDVARTFDVVVTLAPDLLIIDLAVGQDAGPALLASLRQRGETSGIPIIVVSTDRRLLDTARRIAPASERVRYIAKPLDIDDLMGAVRQLVGVA